MSIQLYIQKIWMVSHDPSQYCKYVHRIPRTYFSYFSDVFARGFHFLLQRKQLAELCTTLVVLNSLNWWRISLNILGKRHIHSLSSILALECSFRIHRNCYNPKNELPVGWFIPTISGRTWNGLMLDISQHLPMNYETYIILQISGHMWIRSPGRKHQGHSIIRTLNYIVDYYGTCDCIEQVQLVSRICENRSTIGDIYRFSLQSITRIPLYEVTLSCLFLPA